MLVGEYEHTVDDKNRLTLPARFRDSFPQGGVLTRGMDGCLNVYAREEWERLVESRLGSLDPLSRDDRMLQRYFFSGAAEFGPDKQGRIMLPASLMQHAGLSKEVVVAGVFDHLEIWDRAAWRDQMRQVEGSAEDVAERLAAKRD
jgi:MraZ protein